MVIETGVVSSAQAIASSSNSKIKPEPQEISVQETPVVSIGETFFSPVIKIDAENQSAILQFRDSETGEVTKEYPSDSVKVYESKVAEEPATTPVKVENEAQAIEQQVQAQEVAQAVQATQGEQPAQNILV